MVCALGDGAIYRDASSAVKGNGYTFKGNNS